MISRLLLLACLGLAACAAAPDRAERRQSAVLELPPMKRPPAGRVALTRRSNAAIARDFLDLSFELESGRSVPVFTRFEGPIGVRVTGPAPPSLGPDLRALLERLRREAGIDIATVPAGAPAAITIEAVPRGALQRVVPQAACFVVPRVSSWEEFRASRRGPTTDWTTLRTRTRLSIFVPADVSPQEVRDCLHEELAQALGPLNDLYRLTDSVFNDDNFHTVLTGFDMLILRATYAPELRSGMTRDEVARALPAILARLNPGGARLAAPPPSPTPRAWTEAVQTALGPDIRMSRRRAAARRAIAIAHAQGWSDTRLAFSLFALGRLSLSSDPDIALGAFLQAAVLYAQSEETALQEAHIAMQLAAFALSAGQVRLARDIVDANTEIVLEAQNAALLATLLLIKAEALDRLGQPAEAAALRRESLGWARYGFGDDDEVRRRAAEIAAIAPAQGEGAS